MRGQNTDLLNGGLEAPPLLRTLHDRSGLPQLLNELHLVGEGVEVGVHQGEFSEHILSHWHGRVLHLVDPWAAGGAYGSDRTVNLLETIQHVERFTGRYKIHRDYSTVVASVSLVTYLRPAKVMSSAHCVNDIDTSCLASPRARWPEL